MVPLMLARAASFAARAESPPGIVRAAREQTRQVDQPQGMILFVSGSLETQLPEIGCLLREACPDLPALVVGAHGVLTERGELEGVSAGAGILWSGGRAECVAMPAGDPGVDRGLTAGLQKHADPRKTAFVFARPRGFSPQTLEPLAELGIGALIGGGTPDGERVLSLMPGCPPVIAGAGAIVLSGLSPPLVGTSPACRLLLPLAPVTRTLGPMVLEIDGRPALSLLSSAAEGLAGQQLVLAAISSEKPDRSEAPQLVLRGIQGVDPARQGLVLSNEVHPGAWMSFAVRDGAAARTHLQSTLLQLRRQTGGAAPRFGVYLSCAGRGSALYGARDVDVRILRAHFPNLPIAGAHSSFEIAPHAGVPTLQLYAGVLALFSTPS